MRVSTVVLWKVKRRQRRNESFGEKNQCAEMQDSFDCFNYIDPGKKRRQKLLTHGKDN